MILLLDTSTPICRLRLVDGEGQQRDAEWEADRGLADGLLTFLKAELGKDGKDWNDIAGLGILLGPGSFTGLRIGITVFNTIAEAKNIPIVGTEGGEWQQAALSRLSKNENDQMVLPRYGRDATITKPRK